MNWGAGPLNQVLYGLGSPYVGRFNAIIVTQASLITDDVDSVRRGDIGGRAQRSDLFA
jgi:hypothetical protein